MPKFWALGAILPELVTLLNVCDGSRNCQIFSGHSSDPSRSLAVERDVVVAAAADAGDAALEPGRSAVAPPDEEGAREADRQLRGHQERRLIEPRSWFRVQFPAASSQNRTSSFRS